MNVFFFRTKWALLLYILYTKDWEDTFYCFNCESEVPDYFRDNKIRYFVYKKNNNSQIMLIRAFTRLRDEFRYLFFIKKMQKQDGIHFFGDDDSILSKPFVRKNFVVVEDGLANYTPENVQYLQKIDLLGYDCKYKVMGFDPIITKVLLSGAFVIPSILEKKAVAVDVKQFWQRKSEKEKTKILNVFNTTTDELKKYKADYVLLTQNYDSYNINTQENELSRYQKILKNYPVGKVMIKPHPASIFNYKRYFPDYEVIPQEIPFELMALYNDYSVLICINSTAAFTVPGDKRVDLYDLEGNLWKRYNLTHGKKIRVDELKSLIPVVNESPYTVKKAVKKLRYIILKKLVWHLD